MGHHIDNFLMILGEKAQKFFALLKIFYKVESISKI